MRGNLSSWITNDLIRFGFVERGEKELYNYYANGVLNYADFATGKSVVLCTRAGCNHVENVPGEEPRDATGGSLKELGVLTKNYSRREKGIYSLLGPNGAGKSTITSAMWYAGIGTALREIMPNSKSF